MTKAQESTDKVNV